MTTSQTEVESRVTELATQAFKTFCNDVSGMFGVDAECEQREILSETIPGLKKRFNTLVAVNIIEAEGILDGTFQFIFDREGLFTLGGIIAALPEETIMSNRNNASSELAEGMIDATEEAGNLLVGSWNKVFSERLEGHNSFSHRLPALVGQPWGKSEETMGLAGDEEVFFLPYEMTVGSYPAFNCGVIFPKTIFGDISDFEPEENTQEETADNTQEIQTATEKTDSEESNEEPAIVEESKQEQPSAEETPAETSDAGEIEEQAQTEQAPEDTADSDNAAAEQSNAEESQLREPDVSSDHEDTAPDPNAATDSTNSEESNKESDTIEGSDEEEFKQEQPSAEETPAETSDTEEIEEDAQTEQVPEDTVDPEDATTDKQSEDEESQLQEPDESSYQDDVAQDPNAADGVADVTAAVPETSEEPTMSKIYEAIQNITQSPAVLPGQSTTAKKTTPDITELFEICANDIMQNQVTWAGPDDTLQQAFAKMQQTDSGYIMIGQNGALEGIVSKSDITKAMSPYLLPIFAKWRRPLDDATLKIRIKWIMSRPVRTIKPKTPLATIMEHMSQFRGRCLPVMDEEGNVQGLVTAFDIFQALLKSNPNTCATGETAQEPVESASTTETT